MAENTLYVIDFDRTLIDVDEMMNLAEKACEGLGIDFPAIRREQERASEEAWSYSPLETIRKAGEKNFGLFKERFLKAANPKKLVFADGAEYINKLDQAGRPYMIMTYAADVTWQKMKLEASGFSSVPHIITLSKLKGREISGWRLDDGTYKPPLENIKPADSIVLIDDRLRVFKDLPEDCTGYFINRPGKTYADADIPPNVTEIASFSEIIALS